MLEALMNPQKAKPYEVFILTAIFTLLAFFFSYIIFPDYVSVLGCAFLTILFVPFFQHLFLDEEKKEEWATKHKVRENVLNRHEHVLVYYSTFFLAAILILSFLFFFLPDEKRSLFFAKQIDELRRISGLSTGMVISPASKMIFLNNTLVMILAFVSSFLFGTGAVFVLSWNASVIATFAGTWAQSLTSKGLSESVAFLYGVPNALLAIALHGIPEIMGYFFAGFAGGILSVGLLREKFGTPEFKQILFDAIIFLLIGEYCIFIASFIETGTGLLSIVEFIFWAITMIILFISPKIKI